MHRAWLLPIAMLLQGCPAPIAAVPTVATATRDNAVCWSSKLTKDPLHALVEVRLLNAGYILSDRACDVSVQWSVLTRYERHSFGGRGSAPHGVRAHYSNAKLVVRRGDAIIDELQWSFGEFDIPQDEPDRLAILFVNALNSSSKLASLPPVEQQ